MNTRDGNYKGTILLVSRAPIAGYPPTLAQGDILSGEGFFVIVGDTSGQEEMPAVDGKISVHYSLGRIGGSQSSLSRAVKAMAFQRSVRRLIKKCRPDVIIAYDPEACMAVGDAAKKHRSLLLWHFHELWQAGSESMSVRWATRYIHRHACKPDLIIIPDRDRAQIFASATGISRNDIQVVMNCPRTLHDLSAIAPDSCAVASTKSSQRYVVYNGSVGPHHGLEIAVRSMVHWPADTVFVIKGTAKPDYDRALEKIASDCGVSARVRRISYSPGYGAYVGAHIGWTVLEPVVDNWKYSAGASNKRFECMAVGIPQITDDTEATAELIEKVGCGMCISPHSVEDAAAAVNALLSDDGLRIAMGQRGRAAHLQRLNYETEFAPVVSYLKEKLKA